MDLNLQEHKDLGEHQTLILNPHLNPCFASLVRGTMDLYPEKHRDQGKRKTPTLKTF